MIVYESELYHYGVPGMKWGVRKAVQNVGRSYVRTTRKAGNALRRVNPVSRAYTYTQKKGTKLDKAQQTVKAKAQQTKQKLSTPEAKKAMKIGAAVAGTALAAYGGYRLSKFVKDKNAQLIYQAGKEKSEEYLRNNYMNKVSFVRGENSSSFKAKNVSGSFNTRDGAYNHVRNANKQIFNDAMSIRTKAHADSVRARKNTSTVEAAKNVAGHYGKIAADKASSSAKETMIRTSLRVNGAKYKAGKAANSAARKAKAAGVGAYANAQAGAEMAGKAARRAERTARSAGRAASTAVKNAPNAARNARTDAAFIADIARTKAKRRRR